MDPDRQSIIGGDSMSLFIEYGVKSQNLAPDPFVKVFTSSQVWDIPEGVKKVDITLVGGGEGGDTGSVIGSAGGYLYGGDGSNGGEVINLYDVDISIYQSLSIIIGAGGLGVPRGYGYENRYEEGENGSPTLIKNGSTTLYQARGGYYERGSGGGEGCWFYYYGYTYERERGGRGGSDGGYGKNTEGGNYSPGKGQGTTTKGVNNVLYSGGGGGGGCQYKYDGKTYLTYPGEGGDGGGGRGGSGTASASGGNGTSNTGGGGGGGGINHDTWYNLASGNGGSGLVIVKFNGED